MVQVKLKFGRKVVDGNYAISKLVASKLSLVQSYRLIFEYLAS